MIEVPTLSNPEFDKLTRDVWVRLLPIIPRELQSHFDRIQILIEDEPTPEFVKEVKASGDGDLVDDPEELCGFFIGVPMPESSVTSPDIFPARVYLFRKALLDLADFDGTPAALADLREEIAVTLLHEIGHFFGLDEDDLERLGFD